MIEVLNCSLGAFLSAKETKPSIVFPGKTIVISELGIPSMRQPFTWKDVPLSLYQGIDLVDFVELAEGTGMAGASIEDSNYALIAFREYPQRVHRDDAVWIGDLCLRTVPKDGLAWCQPGMQLFHYA